MSLTLKVFKYYMISKTVALKIEQSHFDNTVPLFFNVIYKLVLLLNSNTQKYLNFRSANSLTQ